MYGLVSESIFRFSLVACAKRGGSATIVKTNWNCKSLVRWDFSGRLESLVGNWDQRSRINLNNFATIICYGHLPAESESESTHLNLRQSAALWAHDDRQAVDLFPLSAKSELMNFNKTRRSLLGSTRAWWGVDSLDQIFAGFALAAFNSSKWQINH